MTKTDEIWLETNDCKEECVFGAMRVYFWDGCERNSEYWVTGTMAEQPAELIAVVADVEVTKRRTKSWFL